LLFVGAFPVNGTNTPDSVLAPIRMHDALIACQIPSALSPTTKALTANRTPSSSLALSAASTALIYRSASASYPYASTISVDVGAPNSGDGIGGGA